MTKNKPQRPASLTFSPPSGSPSLSYSSQPPYKNPRFPTTSCAERDHLTPNNTSDEDIAVYNMNYDSNQPARFGASSGNSNPTRPSIGGNGRPIENNMGGNHGAPTGNAMNQGHGNPQENTDRLNHMGFPLNNGAINPPANPVGNPMRNMMGNQMGHMANHVGNMPPRITNGAINPPGNPVNNIYTPPHMTNGAVNPPGTPMNNINMTPHMTTGAINPPGNTMNSIPSPLGDLDNLPGNYLVQPSRNGGLNGSRPTQGISTDQNIISGDSSNNTDCDNTTGTNNRMCRNCRDCVNCCVCTDCTNCTNCTNCVGCRDSVNLLNCLNCVGCTNCSNCSSLVNEQNLSDVHR